MKTTLSSLFLFSGRPHVVAPLLVLLVLFSAIRLRGQPPLLTDDGFAVPQPNHVFNFPRDHGSHPEFKIEWWYLTGHLFDAKSQRFGFQATFFRQANSDNPKDSAQFAAHTADSVTRSPTFGYDQIFLAHFALTDVKNNRFYFQERLNREGWDASSSVSTLDVRNGPWSLRLVDPTKNELELRGSIRGEASLALTFTPQKPLVRFGEKGVSRKGAEPTAASYYLTFPRLHAEGTVSIGGNEATVKGEAWMDHEISSSQLGTQQIGWDWLSIQFTDQRELMLYRLRHRDGSADAASACTWVEKDTSLHPTEFGWEVLDTWQSSASGARYPSRVRVSANDPATGKKLQFTIEPLVKNQELTGQIDNIPYWEGACRVLDETGKNVGSAYLELTGYAKNLRL